jgi:hypothetical protein
MKPEEINTIKDRIYDLYLMRIGYIEAYSAFHEWMHYFSNKGRCKDGFKSKAKVGVPKFVGLPEIQDYQRLKNPWRDNRFTPINNPENLVSLMMTAAFAMGELENAMSRNEREILSERGFDDYMGHARLMIMKYGEAIKYGCSFFPDDGDDAEGLARACNVAAETYRVREKVARALIGAPYEGV